MPKPSCNHASLPWRDDEQHLPLTAFLLALAAAFVHASWNLLTARAEASQTATGVSLTVGALVFAPVAAVKWRIDAAAIPYAAVSVVLELCYFALLAAAYQRGPLSVVYPVARGAAPVLVAGFAAVFLGVSLSVAQIVGVLLVAGGIVLVRGLDRASRGGDIALALAIAGVIAAYTLVDKQALKYAHPLAYLELVIAPTAAIYLAVITRIAGAHQVRRAAGGAAAVAGVGMFGAYALTLVALQRAAAAPVAAVRETSIVIAAALAAKLMHERVGPVRAGGAALVCTGIALLALA
jgi:drug/metabolite transporter (DMT)-like permease